MYVHTIILQEAVDRKDALLHQKDEELALLRSQQTAKSLTKLMVRFFSGLISERNTTIMSHKPHECFP